MTPEGKVLKEITDMLADLKRCKSPIWWVKLHGGPMQKKGLPDLLVVYQGRAVFMEVKAPGGEATKLQAHIIKQLQAAGAKAEVVTSVHAARQLLFDSRI